MNAGNSKGCNSLFHPHSKKSDCFSLLRSSTIVYSVPANLLRASSRGESARRSLPGVWRNPKIGMPSVRRTPAQPEVQMEQPRDAVTSSVSRQRLLRRQRDTVTKAIRFGPPATRRQPLRRLLSYIYIDVSLFLSIDEIYRYAAERGHTQPRSDPCKNIRRADRASQKARLPRNAH